MQPGYLTLPNTLSLTRLIGSPALVWLAWQGWHLALVIWVVVLVLTEWLDGLLARALHQQSKLGARLDTVADAFFYLSVLVALTIYDRSLVLDQLVWIGAAIVSYWLSWLVSGIKFRRLPSYHTWAAKLAWLIIGIGVFTLITGATPWLFRLAMVVVIVANVEGILISLKLTESRVDVPSLWHAFDKQRHDKQRHDKQRHDETGSSSDL